MLPRSSLLIVVCPWLISSQVRKCVFLLPREQGQLDLQTTLSPLPRPRIDSVLNSSNNGNSCR